MRFWDTSAIVPLLVEEAASERVRSVYQENPALLAWWGTGVECASAIARLERDGSLTRAASENAFRRLSALQASWQEVQPSSEIQEIAIRFLRVHPLRAADALQLAAAFVAAERRPSTLAFLCLDDRLRNAATLEGFAVPL